MNYVLTVEKRETTGKKNESLRTAGRIPAVVYGPKEDAESISVDARSFEKLYKEIGDSTIIEMKGVGDDKDVLVHDIDYDPIKGGVRHIDFYAIERGKKLQIAVQLEFEGDSEAVKQGGVLTKVLHELEIETLPRHLPQYIAIDMSKLASFGDQIQIKDVVLPEGVEALGDPEDVIAVVNEAVEEPEETEAAEVDMDAIEVEKKGKEGGAEESADDGGGE